MEKALKNSLASPEICQNVDENVAQNDTVSAEDLFVDDLLDFSKVEDEFGIGSKIEDETTPFHLASFNVESFESPPVHETQPCLPADELADLEWLSNFVDDSTPGYSLTMPVENIRVKPDPKPNVTEKCSFTFSVQTKARSKRVRNNVRVWSLNESASSSSSSSSSSCSQLSRLVLYNDITYSAESFEKPVIKKQKQENGGEPRRCSHCLVQKTPQWRAGPMGAKTLCNACGVRYKSGRLLPEYRPAISPTFSSDKHSNNHRKVMEMRRKKEGDNGFVMPVESF